MTVEKKTFKIRWKHERVLVVLMGVGVLGLLAGWITAPERTWANFLLNSFYFLTLSLSGLFFLALHYVSGARWSEVLRRIPESMMSYLPVGGVVLLGVLFGVHSLYHWSHANVMAEDAVLAAKAGYLNVPFFVVRMVGVLLLWVVFARVIRKNSLLQDQTGDVKYHRKNVKNSILFLIVFALSFTIASFDWIMSLDPHWFSTVFAIYCFSGMFVNGLAVICIMAAVLYEYNYLPQLNENHCHDLGKLVFAFTMFWAYIWYFQYMLIWYGNIPEETVYFVHRIQNDWNWLFYFNFFINFLVPFFVLLPRGAKRNAGLLKRVCIVLLVGHWLDLYLMIMPEVLPKGASIGALEVSISLGFAGLFIWVSARALSRAPILPQRSPFLEESLHYHQ